MSGLPRSPRLARWLLQLCLPRAEREFVIGDLEETFVARVEEPSLEGWARGDARFPEKLGRALERRGWMYLESVREAAMRAGVPCDCALESAISPSGRCRSMAADSIFLPVLRYLVAASSITCMMLGMPAMTITLPSMNPGAIDTLFSTNSAPKGMRAMRIRAGVSSTPRRSK